MRRSDGTQFVGKFATSKGRHAQSDLMTMLAPHRPAAPIEGPVMATVRRHRSTCTATCSGGMG